MGCCRALYAQHIVNGQINSLTPEQCTYRVRLRLSTDGVVQFG